MSEREHEQARDERRGPAPEARADKQVARAPAHTRSDVRVHTDTGGGALARALAAGAGLSHAPVSGAGDRALARQLAHAVGQRGVARDLIDDVRSWFGSEEQTATRVAPKEVAVNSKDAQQLMTLVEHPLSAAKGELGGEIDVAKSKSAAAKLGPAAAAVRVIAGSKQEQANFERIGALLPDIVAAEKTLEIMADDSKAKTIWKEYFDKAMAGVDELLRLPIQDESKDDQGKPPAPSDDTLTQRDHDLIEGSLKRPLQQLIEKTSGEPYADWDPKAVGADATLLSATHAFSNRRMLGIRNQIAMGLQAVKAFAMSLEDQRNEAIAKIDSALSTVTQLIVSWADEQVGNPDSPLAQPPIEK